MALEETIQNILKEIGLTELQIRCYLTLLKLQGTKVTQLSKELGVNRPNTYSLINKLKEYDLLYEENLISGKIIYAQPYQNVEKLVKKKKEQIEQNLSSLKSIKPLFDNLIKTSEFIPKVRTYDTKYTLDTIATDILAPKQNKEILLFSNQATEKHIFSKRTHDEFIKKRVENNIKIKVLAVDNKEGRLLKKLDSKANRETRILPKHIDFQSEIYLYDNKIAMVDVKEEVIGVIIESTELNKIQTQLFHLIWEISKKSN